MWESMVDINIIKIVHALFEQWLSDVFGSGCFHVPGCVWLENEQKTRQQISCCVAGRWKRRFLPTWMRPFISLKEKLWVSGQ